MTFLEFLTVWRLTYIYLFCGYTTYFNPSLSDGPDRVEGAKGSPQNFVRKGLYSTKNVSMGFSDIVCQEKGWVIENVHELSSIKQSHHKEQIPAL